MNRVLASLPHVHGWRPAALAGAACFLGGVVAVVLFQHALGLARPALAMALAAGTCAALALALAAALSGRRGQADKEQNERFAGALNNMKQGLCMFDAEGRAVVWNQRYIDMYRIDPQRIWPGVTLLALLEARADAGTFPLETGSYDAELRASLQQGRAFTIVTELPDGRAIEVINQPMPSGGWVATHEDITDRQRAERALEQTRTFLNTIIENVPSPIMVKDAVSRRYLLVNREAENHLGVSREAILGKSAAEALPPETAVAVEAEDERLLRSGATTHRDEHAVVTPGNGVRIVSSTRHLVRRSDGEPQYLIIVMRDLTEQRRHEQRIAHMKRHDPLTDLPNRAAFNECIAASADLAAVAGESFAVLCIDVDHFKTVNDVYGHSVGDLLLHEVAARLGMAAQGAFIARTGGDEFTAISPVGPQPESAEALAQRLSAALGDDIVVDGHAVRVGITIGISLYPQDSADAAGVVANANAALSRAKSEARGSIRFFEPSMDQQLRDKRALQQDLRTAIAHDELTLHYQPQARIDGTVTGFEALARWNHPRHGMVPPSTFIPLAEEDGSIIALGAWVLRKACREAASWPRPLQIAVNLSPAQFQDDGLPTLVHHVLLGTGLVPERLELEITEGVLIGDFNRAVAILRRLKNLGVRIAMDDFGTGYSSLSYLQSFPFDKIKIDRAFVANINHSDHAATIIRAVIALGRGLSLPVMAEGVETEEQLRFLAVESCDEVQGYYIGRPLPISDYAELIGRAPFGKGRRKSSIAIAS